nr:hypothetical protein [uncultured Ruegeria sp.]
MAKRDEITDKLDAFPLDRFKTQLAVIIAMTETLANPESWSGVSAQKMREATRMLEQAKTLIETATHKMGAIEAVVEPTLIDEIHEEMKRRALGNAELGEELRPPMSRQNVWGLVNGRVMPGAKVRSRLKAWLDMSRELPGEGE